MDAEDIIRLMEESGLAKGAGMIRVSKFANMVAAFEREECAKVVEQAGMDGYGTLAAALLVRERGAP
jgi:hypothetical protein